MDLNKILNPVIGVAGLLSLALSATFALAESNETIKIKVKTDDGISETVVIDNLEVGATDVFVTESGREVLVTREKGAMTLEVDGKVIDIKIPRIESLHMKEFAGHRIARQLKFISEDGAVVHEFGSDDDLHFSCSVDSDDCSGDAKAVWIESGDFTSDVTIEGIDGANVFVKRIELHQDGDVDLDELLEGLDIDIESLGDGTEDHEVIIIKRHIEIHEDTEDN